MSNVLSTVCFSTFLHGIFNKKKPKPINKEQFSRWLTGFIDGEGNFQVFLDRHYLKVMFRIRLHKDDLEVLIKIRDFLGAGRVLIDKNSSLFIISDLKSLLKVLFPLLAKYNLYTTKWLDYNDFKSLVLFLSKSNSTRVSSTQLKWVRDITTKMNSDRINYNYTLIPNITVNPYWLLGFIEAEGTFGFKNLSPYFQIGQHTRSLNILEAITVYLKSLPKGFNFSLNSGVPTVSQTLNKRTSVSVISIVNIDTLYDYLLFFFLDMPFQTRKAEDFYLWALVLHLHKWGYFYLPEGRSLTYQISQYINTGRYSTNPTPGLAVNLTEIKKILNLELPVKLLPEMLHVDLAKSFASKIKSKTIYVYDNGKLLNKKPCSSFAKAMELIGYSKSSVAARRSIDTNKVVAGRYTFYSKLL